MMSRVGWPSRCFANSSMNTASRRCQNKAEPEEDISVLGTNRTVDVCIFPSLSGEAVLDEPRAELSMRQGRTSVRSALVLEIDLQPSGGGFWNVFAGGIHKFRKFFLKASCLPISFLG